MRTSSNGLQFITDAEGYRDKVYLDSAGFPTVGVGHLLTRTEKATMPVGTRITRDEVMALLKVDLADAETTVNTLVKVPVNQNQFDALISLVFNIGTGNFKQSSVLRFLNEEDYDAAADAFGRYVMAGGKRTKGLVTRRASEAKLFRAPVSRSLSAESQPDTPPVSQPSATHAAHGPATDSGATNAADVQDPRPPTDTASVPSKTVELPAATGGSQTAKGLSWQLPSLAMIVTVAGAVVSQVVAGGRAGASTAFGFLQSNYCYFAYVAMAAIAYFAIRKILTYIPAILEFKNKANPDTHDVTFVAAT